MSRRRADRVAFRIGFPRVSGDEPQNTTGVSRVIVFSPRERG